MQFDISQMALIESNFLSFNQIYGLIKDGTSIALSGTDICDINFVLGNRTNLNHIRYYFSSATASGTVASGISFYYKDADEDSYTELTTNMGSGYYYANLGTPKYIKVIHTISGTGITGNITGIELYTDDDEVDFGTDGTTTSKSYNYVYESNYQIENIPIYNDGPQSANAYVFVESDDYDLKQSLALSNSAAGPWTKIYDQGDLIVGPYNLDKGTYTDTQNNSGILELDGTTASGTYESVVYRSGEDNKFKILKMDYTLTSGTKITADPTDSYLSIEMRSSNVEPIPIIIYRIFYWPNPYDLDLRYRDYWLHDNSLYYTSDILYDTGDNTYYDSSVIYIDPEDSDNFVGFGAFRYPGTVYPTNLAVIHRSYEGATQTKRLYQHYGITSQNYYAYGYFTFLSKEGDVWLYTSHNDDSDNEQKENSTMNKEGYYLFHISSDWDIDFTLYRTSNFIDDYSYDYENGYLYYYDNNDQMIVKRNKNGESEYVSSFGGISIDFKALTAKEDGTVFFLDGSVIKKLDNNGNLVDDFNKDITNQLDTVRAVHLMEYDKYHDLFWLADYQTIYCLYSDFRLRFKVAKENTKTIYPTEAGLWLHDSGEAYLIDIDLQAIKYQTDKLVTDDRAGIHVEHYDSINPSFPSTPLDGDPEWSALEWTKVAPEGYMLPNKKYHQARITLRTDYLGVATPSLLRLYTVPTVKVEDVPPGGYKNVYLRTNTNSLNLGENYSTYLTVGWEVPI